MPALINIYRRDQDVITSIAKPVKRGMPNICHISILNGKQAAQAIPLHFSDLIKVTELPDRSLNG